MGLEVLALVSGTWKGSVSGQCHADRLDLGPELPEGEELAV